MATSKFAVILPIYGAPSDRFMAIGYRPGNLTPLEMIEMAGKQGIVQGLELIEGAQEFVNNKNKKEIKAAIDNYGLDICGINPNLHGEQQWAKGTIGSTDPKIRRMAIDRIKGTMDLAAEMESDFVGIWPGQDGHDYMFEVDYQKVYEWWVKGMQECADHNPNVRLGLEYKPFEPRARSFVSTNPKVLLLLRDIQRKNVGLTFDVGHSLFARENLGEVVALSQMHNQLFHVHLNDNYADWDWDMNFGSVHTLDFIEMIYWLKRTNYQGWYSVDIFAYRTNSADSISESLKWLQALMELVERAGQPKLDELVAASDPIAASRFLRELLFNTKS